MNDFRNYPWKDRICSTDTSIVNRWPGPYRSLLCIILKVELYMLTFWLVLTYNLLEDRHINDVINTLFVSLLHKTSRFHVALRLFGNRDVKRTSVTHSAVASCSTFFCSNRILTSSVIYYWTDTRQPGIYLLITQSS